MVVHLGRLRLVIRRKKGRCVYKYCPKNNILRKGTKVFVVTKLGMISGRQTIFYKAFHRDCFGPWALYSWDTHDPNRDGRPSMSISGEDRDRRALLVRTRARLLRRLREVTTGKELDPLVVRIAEVDKDIEATGYPLLYHKGRRSKAEVEFDKFIGEVKDKYKSEMRVPKEVWDEAELMGFGTKFNEEMGKWRKEDLTGDTSTETQTEDMEEPSEV